MGGHYVQFRSKFRRFLQRHEQLLVFVGMFTVFGTFILREGISEKLKEASESLKTAQARLDNVGFTATLMNGLCTSGDVLEKVNRLDDDMYEWEMLVKTGKADPHKSLTDDEEFQADLARASDVLDVRTSLLARSTFIRDGENALPSVFDLVPETAKDKKEVEDMAKRSDGMLSAVKHTPQIQTEELRAKNRKDQQVLVDSINESYYDLGRRMEAYLTGLQSTNKRKVQEATQGQEQAERRYKRSVVASYILYSFGWGLGLVAKIAGIKSVGGE